MKVKPQAIRHPKSSILEEVRQSFERWRATRENFGPIPSELWNKAVELLLQEYCRLKIPNRYRYTLPGINTPGKIFEMFSETAARH